MLCLSFFKVSAMNYPAKALSKNQKIRFKNEKYYFTVRSVRHPFVICTLSIFGENYHTILNVNENIRGAGTSTHFGHLSDDDVEESMNALHGRDLNGFEQAISPRDSVPIVITDVMTPTQG